MFKINHLFNTFFPLWGSSSFFPTVLLVIIGFPKNAYSLTCAPPFDEEFIFFIPLSTLCCENPFSPTKNAFKAYSSIFFSNFI
jgi:hypothetical protein